MGNAHRSSFWVARVDAAGETLWTVEAQGFLGQSFADLEIPYRTLSTNRTNGIAFAVPMFGNANAAELVDGVGVGVSVTPITGDAGSVIYDLDVSGRIQERARVSAAPGAAIISALRLLDDRRIVVSGLVGGGVLNIQSKNGSTTQVPTGIGGEALEPWIAMLNADGTVQWSWHIFVRPSFSGPSPNDPTVKALPFIIPQGENGLLFPVFSGKPIDGRPGTGMASPLSPTWPETAGFRTTLIELDSNTGALNRSVLLQSTQSIATAGTVFRNNAYIAGVIDGSATSTWNVFVPSGNSLARPFVLGVDRWAEVVATSQTDDPLVEPYDAILQPLLSANSEAIFVGYQTEVAFRTLDRDNGVSVNRPAIVVRRLNENSALDCE